MTANRNFGFRFGVSVVLGLVWGSTAASAGTLFPGPEIGAGDEPWSVAIADLDSDGGVGLTDSAGFWDCLTGPCTDSPCEPLYTDPCCGTGDFDGDADVDLQDSAGFQQASTGESQ